MAAEKFDHENTPNAGKFMASLRYSGYENKIAISDLIDNSLDAEASTVEIAISGDLKSGGATVSIVDNGIGMDKETLAQALRLGSLIDRDVDSDLGRFGMGLVTASISIARRIEVYTKAKGSPLLVGIMDLDVMEKTNRFGIHLENASPEQEKAAKSYGLKAEGTVVVLKECDKLNRVELNEFENKLKDFLGETYRYFLRAGKEITVNGKRVQIIDPMWQDGRYVETHKMESDIEFEKSFDVKVAETGEKERFTVKVFRLPEELPAKEMKKIGINRDTQGFYVLRNFRQVAKADDFGIWKRHNSLNRVRVEVLVSGRLDSVMGINYTKHTVHPSEAVIDKLVNELMPHIESLRTQYPRKKAASASAELDFSEVETQIKQKAKLLEKAESETQETTPRKTQTGKVVDVSAHTRGLPQVADVVRFDNANLGASGPIFKAAKEAKLTVITWNNAHPFFQKVVFGQRDEEELLNAVSFIAYALGEAKLKYSTPETHALLDAVMDTMSKNLKTLFD